MRAVACKRGGTRSRSRKPAARRPALQGSAAVSAVPAIRLPPDQGGVVIVESAGGASGPFHVGRLQPHRFGRKIEQQLLARGQLSACLVASAQCRVVGETPSP